MLELNLELDDEMNKPNKMILGGEFPAPRRDFDRLVAADSGDDRAALPA